MTPSLAQSPTDPAFVQDPYPFYERARALGPFFHWRDYGLTCTVNAALVNALLRDRRLGRELPPGRAAQVPPHLAAFYAVEAHSMLELEPPRHTRLRGLVLRAFTSRSIAALGPGIERLTHDLIDRFPATGSFDLLPAFARPLPVIVIARLLGVPEAMSDDLLAWSNAMVGMYQAGRTRAMEEAAARAAAEFSDFLREYMEARRRRPAEDLISRLVEAEAEGERLTADELVSTCILLLNAGHEATVHTLGNGVKAILEHGGPRDWLSPSAVEGTVEEILRYDAPLHLFTRQVYEDVEIAGTRLPAGSEVGLLLAAANRDPSVWAEPARFDPARSRAPHASFGAGLHFCVGAPLARLELQIALPALFERRPGLRLAATPGYAPLYHFHGLSALLVS